MKPSRLAFLTLGMAVWALTACARSERAQPLPIDLPDAALSDAALFDAALPGGDALDAALDGGTGGAPGGRLRIVAGNLTSGNNQAYEPPGVRIFRGLAADVAMIQEFNVAANSPADLRSFVDQAFGPEFVFARGAASGQIPNGIASRYPIVASGVWTDPETDTRDFVWAQIDIPGPKDLYAISVHLLTRSATARDAEAGALLRNIRDLPADAYIALGGDFNTDVRSEPCVQTLSAALTTTGPFPVDQGSDGDTNMNRNKPYDWVLANGALDALETDVAIGRNTFADGLVVDTRVYAPIADLSPALAGDSGAASMQHMAVVRDFALPGLAEASVQVTAPNGGESWPAGSSQLIRWTASGVQDVSVELTTDGTTWTSLSASTPAATGQLRVTAPATVTTAARVRVTAVPGGTPGDVSDAPFAISAAGRVFLNELLANEPDGDVAREAVELVNGGTTDVDLSGWTISDAGAVRHAFAAGTVLGAGRALVVFGDATGIPAGLGNAVAASTGLLNLSNSGDTVTLASPAGAVDSVTYTSALSGTDGVSMNRGPDGDAAGGFVLHTTLSQAQSSPGTRVDGTAF